MIYTNILQQHNIHLRINYSRSLHPHPGITYDPTLRINNTLATVSQTVYASQEERE